MEALARLKLEADRSARLRGHKMAGWVDFGDGTRSTNICGLCDRLVTVTTQPAPNDIDIGGEAVAVNCTGGDIRELQLDAVEKAQENGHTIGQWTISPVVPDLLGVANCVRCGAFVAVNAKADAPRPVYGTAFIRECNHPEHRGSLSSDTMRSEDLIPIFMFYLENHDRRAATRLTSEYSGLGWPYSQCGLAFGDPFDEVQEELASDLLEDLFDALDLLADEGYYFGAHPGNGSDYGFWMLEPEVR